MRRWGVVARVAVIAAMISACSDPSGGSIDAPASDGASPDAADPAMLATCRGTVDFGSVTVNNSSGVATVTVTNVGPSTSGPVMADLVGEHAAWFELVGTTCTTLLPGAACTVSTKFKPTGFGVADAGLTVTASPGGSVTIALIATGRSLGGISVSPVGHNFGPVLMGSTSTEASFTVTNGGDMSTGAMSVSFGGANPTDFAITSQTCSGTLAAGASCTIAIQFAPTVNGARTAAVTVSSSPGGSASAPLTGTGQSAARLEVTPAFRDFGTVFTTTTSAPTTFTVTNTGDAASGLLAAALGGANPGDFVLGTSTCTGIALPGGGTCTIDVSFAPASVGARSALLSMTGTPGGTATASITGSALGNHAPIISPGVHDFGSSVVGVTSTSQDFTIINPGGSTTGTLAVTLSGAAPADFAIATDTCTGTVLAPGAGCIVTLTFTPITTGSRSAVLRITVNPGGSSTAALVGTGT